MPHEDKSVFVLLVFLMREMLHNLLEVLNKPLLTEAKTQSVNHNKETECRPNTKLWEAFKEEKPHPVVTESVFI